MMILFVQILAILIHPKDEMNVANLEEESVKALTIKGHQVLVENNGGFEAGFSNEDYKNAGAQIENKASEIFKNSDFIGIKFFDIFIEKMTKNWF